MASAQDPDVRLEWATDWAEKQLGSHDWDGLCARFVENAYGTQGHFNDAKEMFDKLGVPASPGLPGLIVAFQANDTNGNHGHVGIYMGGDQMISATYNGVQWDSIVKWSEKLAPMVGYIYPPEDWPGVYAERTSAGEGGYCSDTGQGGGDGSPCLNSSTFIADVTYPDGSALSPGQSFNKTWRLQNTGTCTWENYTLAFVSGVQMGGPSSVPVTATEASDTVDITVPLVAPQNDGTYRGYWRLKDTQGVYFGDQVWVEITVPPDQPPPSGCTPSADQVALFVDISYSGQCVVKSVGDYRNPGEIGLPNDSISSLRVGANVKCKIAVKIKVTFSMFELESIYGLGF